MWTASFVAVDPAEPELARVSVPDAPQSAIAGVCVVLRACLGRKEDFIGLLQRGGWMCRVGTVLSKRRSVAADHRVPSFKS